MSTGISASVLSAVAGFVAALVTMGVPLVGFVYRIDRRTLKLHRLVEGTDAVEDDGIIPRLATVEDRTDRHERALRSEGALPVTDGGQRVDDEEDEQ